MSRYFNSYAGLYHFFVCGHRDDVFILNSLEKVDLFEYLYRYLRSRDYKKVLFMTNEGTAYRFSGYDRYSLDEYKKTFGSTARRDAAASGQALNLSHSIKSNKIVKQEPLRPIEKWVMTAEREDLKTNVFRKVLDARITPLLKDDTTKTAIISDIGFFNRIVGNDDGISIQMAQLSRESSRKNIWIILLKSEDELAYSLAASKIFIELPEPTAERVEIKSIREKLGDRLVYSNYLGVDEVKNLFVRNEVLNDADLDYAILDDVAIQLVSFSRENEKQQLTGELKKIPLPLDIKALDGVISSSKDSLTKIQKDIAQYVEQYSALSELANMTGLDLIIKMLNKKQAAYNNWRHSNKNQGAPPIKEPTSIKRLLSVKDNIQVSATSLNLILKGNPGTGKTTIAHLIGRAYKEIGLLESGHTIKTAKDELVAGYVGQTAMKTRQKIDEAMGGVLFIDEAYSLATGGEFGKEAIDTVVEAMTAQGGEFAVIMAGYPDDMDKLLELNDGLKSRFGDQVYLLPDYTPAQLNEIFLKALEKENYQLDETLGNLMPDFFINWYAARDDPKKWGNARAVIKLLGSMIENYSVRMINKPEAGDRLLTAEDVPEDLRQYLKAVFKSEEQALEKLNRLTGLREVKDKVRAFVNTNRFSGRIEGLEKPVAGHYVFYGNPGTGKTHVARIMGDIFRTQGLLSRGHVIEVRRDALVAGYEGQTAIKTLEVCERALDGVLFIDEAYALHGEGNDSFGKEAYDTLMKYMEDNRERFSVIFAGYTAEMNSFIAKNPGMDSRIPRSNRLEFEDYSIEELIAIAESMAKDMTLVLSEGYKERLKAALQNEKKRSEKNKFGNARAVRNILDDSKLMLSNRLAAWEDGGETITEDMYITLTKEDIPATYADAIKIAGAETQEELDFRLVCKDLIAAYNDMQCINYEEDPERFYAEAEKSLLFIEVEENGITKGYGTGFIINEDGYAITCEHVARVGDRMRARIRIKGRPGGDDSWHECKIMNTLEGIDIALIKLEGNNFPCMNLSLPDRKLKRSEKVVLMGYPFGEATEKDFTNFEGGISSSHRQEDEYGDRILLDIQGKKGNSGSPVLSKEDGQVVGIFTGSVIDGNENFTEEINYMRPTKYFWEFFTQ